MRAEHQRFVECSGGLALTGVQKVLYQDLQPEFQDWDDRPCPIDAPSFMPLGGCTRYDDRPLGMFGLIDRRLV
jgi:hypothetical protein